MLRLTGRRSNRNACLLDARLNIGIGSVGIAGINLNHNEYTSISTMSNDIRVDGWYGLDPASYVNIQEGGMLMVCNVHFVEDRKVLGHVLCSLCRQRLVCACCLNLMMKMCLESADRREIRGA
jgi:hypothetical protein